ncbi:MAG: flavin reductase family protein [Pseudobacteriovorax sp.]|nr:flavin reductase family protein [Pseudobacteriovorax sp.]
MIFDMKDFSGSQRYHLMTQSLIPRPIAWVLTSSQDKSWNLAPFSYFTAISSEPPLLMISCGTKAADGDIKDTTRNLRANGRASVMIASSDMINKVQTTADPLAHGVSEVEHAGLNLKSVEGLEFPIVEGVSVAFACSLYEEKLINKQSLLFLEVSSLWVADKVASQDPKGRTVIDPKGIDPLCRLGAGWFGELGSVSKPDSK